MPTDSVSKPKIRVVPFSTDECPKAPTSGPPLFTWRDFYAFRNSVLRTLQNYGTVGPMGEMPILRSWEASQAARRADTRRPDFFVVDDMWNSWSRWNRVEAASHLVNTQLLWDLVRMLEGFPGWCVYLALGRGGLTVFAHRILWEGALFDGAQSIEELGSRCGATTME